MEQLTYKFEAFEGPMDLLLHLISKHKLEITNVPILTLVEQYMAYVRQMQEENLDIASEFLEMAARLVYIKTVSLLPVHEEMQALEQELRGELLEYQDCKRIAGELSHIAQGFGYFSREAAQALVDMTYRRLHEPSELFRHYLAAVGKRRRKLPPPVEAFSGIISHVVVSVSARITAVLATLRGQGRLPFLALFRGVQSRSELVATFLAVLSLAKAKHILIADEGAQPELILVKDGEVEDEFGG